MCHRKGGFTLIELLVVIAVIALLIAILVPSLAKTRELTRRVICASRIHQFILTMGVYAEDYNGLLPSFEQSIAPYTDEVSRKFVLCMRERYGMVDKMFYCPSLHRRALENRLKGLNEGDKDYVVLGYGIWVPRFVVAFNAVIPADINSGAFVTASTNPCSGPKRMSDILGKTNPVVTDYVSTLMIYGPNVDISKDKYVVEFNKTHQWRGVIEMTNQGFIDGHVEKVRGGDMKIRYGHIGGRWQWR